MTKVEILKKALGLALNDPTPVSEECEEEWSLRGVMQNMIHIKVLDIIDGECENDDIYDDWCDRHEEYMQADILTWIDAGLPSEFEFNTPDWRSIYD